ncbi:MAG TPA: acyltransferase family protein, partial [Ktedonobacteraceae bacterium]
MSSTLPLVKQHPESVNRQERARRPHIYELDPLRAATAIVVVAVHVLAFTVNLNQTTTGIQIQNAFVVSVHFTRALFMFVTAFAMTYVYGGKKLPLLNFWKKRGIGVLVPYCIWSIIYVFINQPPTTPSHFAYTSLIAILTGTSSYQMYY